MDALVRKTEHWEISEVIIRRNKAQNGAVVKLQQIYVAAANLKGDDNNKGSPKKKKIPDKLWW